MNNKEGSMEESYLEKIKKLKGDLDAAFGDANATLATKLAQVFIIIMMIMIL